MNIETFVANGFESLQLPVGTSATPLFSSQTVTKYGAILKSLHTNVGSIDVGGSDVAAGKNYPLAPGEQVYIQTYDLGQVYVVSNTTSQVLAIFAYK